MKPDSPSGMNSRRPHPREGRQIILAVDAARRVGDYIASMAAGQIDSPSALTSNRLVGLAWDVGPPIALVFVMALTQGPRLNSVTALTLVLVIAPLLVRRRWPVPVLLMVALGILLTAVRGAEVAVLIPALALASFSVGEAGSDRTRALVLVLGLAAGLTIGLLAESAAAEQAVILPFVILLPSWLVGDWVWTRERSRLAMEDQRERDRQAQLAQVEASALAERQKIARELHDILAHSVSVMVIQAGAARSVVRQSPEDAEKALILVEQAGREAMAEVRGLLGVLSPSDDGGGLAPQPGVSQIGDLVERVREAGLPTELNIEGEPRELPRATDTAVYRIVQEALTNALRYAQQARTLVHLVYEPGQLRIEVLDDGPSATTGSGAAGRGLEGMRQRAATAGGRLDAGPRLGGGYGVRAWLPLQETSA
jgi:signal transduction histidine kinase